MEKNTMQSHFQAMVESEDFMEEIANWLSLLGDKRLLLLRQLVYEIDLSETQQFKDTLYEYGSYLTEKNYFGRQLFSMMAMFIRQMEMGNSLEWGR